jgi:CRISPR-associated protein (TIGR03984 family)
MSTLLHARAQSGVTLAQSLSQSGFADAVALLSSPHEYVAVRFDQGSCRTAEGSAYGLDAVFEARVFDAERELRWLAQDGATGRAVVLSEDEELLPDTFSEHLAHLEAVEILPVGYLLWGGQLSGEDKARLHSARIGTLAIPVDAPPEGGRLRLAAREYVLVEPVHGNAYVGEERLIGFGIAADETQT